MPASTMESPRTRSMNTGSLPTIWVGRGRMSSMSSSARMGRAGGDAAQQGDVTDRGPAQVGRAAGWARPGAVTSMARGLEGSRRR